MKKLVCCLLFVKSLAGTVHDIDTLVEDLMSLMEVPGVAVGIVIDDQVVLAKGYGVRNEEKQLPVTTKTLFPIGSGTKPFTSFLLGQLMDEGLLTWDDPVSDHIPYFKLQDPYTTYTITLRDYLTHMSGYPRHDGVWFNANLSRSEAIRKLRFLEPIYSLREKFLYQQLGYMVAGHVAELSVNKNFEALVAEKIFHPLGMTHSTFSIADMQKRNDFSLGYHERSKPAHYVDATTIAPAGGLNSNVDDLIKWLRLLIHKGEGLIETQTFNEMITPQVVSKIVCNGRYGVDDELIMDNYGLGWILAPYRGHFFAFHSGYIEGFSSVTAFLPKERIGIVILCNRHFSPLPPILTTLLVDKFLNLPTIDWAQKYRDLVDYEVDEFTRNLGKQPSERHENTHPSHPLANYQGSYFHPGYGHLDLCLMGSNLIATFNHLPLTLNHYHYDIFEVTEECPISLMRGLKLTFQENIYGDINSVIVPLEPQGKGILFMKEKDSSLVQEAYLNKFIGNYSYLGFTFVVESAIDKLVVKAFGQPPYNLYPERDNLFTVKEFDGYTIQFLSDEAGVITGIRLTQPNNSTYTAKKL